MPGQKPQGESLSSANWLLMDAFASLFETTTSSLLFSCCAGKTIRFLLPGTDGSKGEFAQPQTLCDDKELKIFLKRYRSNSVVDETNLVFTNFGSLQEESLYSVLMYEEEVVAKPVGESKPVCPSDPLGYLLRIIIQQARRSRFTTHGRTRNWITSLLTSRTLPASLI